MVRYASLVAISLVLLPFAATAEPVKLKLSFFSSDRSTTYRGAAQPFCDGIKSEGAGLLEIETYFSGVLGKEVSKQADLVLNGTADIAVVVAGLARDRFPDNSILEMPGLYRDMREATLVFTQLIAANLLKGYEDFFVIGAYVTEPETIHSRVLIASLGDLKGKKIRINNPVEASVLERLGAIPVFLPVNQIVDALSSGRIDAALVNPSPLNDYGIKRIAIYHYMLETSGAPLLLLMNRKKFESLPKPAQDLIRKYSGRIAGERFVETYENAARVIMRQLETEPQRRIIYPSADDLATARAVFKTVLEEWVAANPRNRLLLQAAESEARKLRTDH